MKLYFKHSGKYTGEEFNIDEVIGSLSSQKILLTSGVHVIGRIDEDFKVEDVKIYVKRLETNTLFWDILVEVHGLYQERIASEVVGGVEEMFGVDIPADYEPLVSLAALAVTYMVARYAYERVAKGKGPDTPPPVHIHSENSVIIQNIADIVHQSPEAVADAIERAVPPVKRRALIPKVADFLRPSRKEPGEQIEVDGAPPISPEALREFPSDAELASVEDSTLVDVERAWVEIRSTDRDKTKSGWGAIIRDDGRFPKRLPMDLYPTVKAEKLAAFHFVRADVVVECDRLADGTLKPKRIHLLSFDPDSGQR